MLGVVLFNELILFGGNELKLLWLISLFQHW